jgi:hypothetical protein
VSPGAAALNLGGLNVLSAPAIATRGNRIVLAYLRHSGIGNAAVLQDLQILKGSDVAGGTPTWSPATTFSVTEAGYGPPLTAPALGHDTRQFLLGVVRQAASGTALRLFIYGSPDGTSWSLVRTCDLVPATPANGLNVSLAGKSDGTLVVMFTAPGVASLVRYTNSAGWSALSSGAIFGTDLPNWYPTALIRAGEPPTP